VEPVKPEYDDNTVMDFLSGVDLISGRETLVPAELAHYKYFPRGQAVFSVSHTNGLASGNVIEEAICHALCEVIERDAISIADLCSSSIPYNILERISEIEWVPDKEAEEIKKELGLRFVDDSSNYPQVNISELAKEFDPINKLVGLFNRADIPLMIKNITHDIGIPSFVASCYEWLSEDYGLFAKGYGTHPDARVALVRAITEASQTRAANIQGARDDLTRIKYKQEDQVPKRKWQFKELVSRNSDHKFKYETTFSQIGTYFNRDILEDIRLILKNLKICGLNRAIIVDLTNPRIGIPVVRAIVPGLETFEVTKSIMGARARRAFKKLIEG
jgi:ribosomal protein S12 methylthiotransferase accessory factor YcaO